MIKVFYVRYSIRFFALFTDLTSKQTFDCTQACVTKCERGGGVKYLSASLNIGTYIFLDIHPEILGFYNAYRNHTEKLKQQLETSKTKFYLF